MFLDALQIQPGDESGRGRVFQLRTRGWLPLRLRWYVNVTSSERPAGFASETWGELSGSWSWRIETVAGGSEARGDWYYCLEKAPLRRAWPLLKPLFALSQDWSLRRGEQGLALELARLASSRGEATPPTAAAPAALTRLSLAPAIVALAGLAALYVTFRLRGRGRS